MKRKNRSINKRDRKIYAVIMQELRDALKTKNIDKTDYTEGIGENYSKRDKTYTFYGYSDFTDCILYINLWHFKNVYIELALVNH